MLTYICKSCNKCWKERLCCKGLHLSEAITATTCFKISFRASNISPHFCNNNPIWKTHQKRKTWHKNKLQDVSLKKPCSPSLSGGICGISEMSLAVKIGLLAKCGVAAVAGVTPLWCNLCEIESRRREGSWAVKGVGEWMATEGFTTEQLHLDVTQTPGGGQEMLSGGHLSPLSVILWRSQRQCYITLNIRGYARIRLHDINPTPQTWGVRNEIERRPRQLLVLSSIWEASQRLAK